MFISIFLHLISKKVLQLQNRSSCPLIIKNLPHSLYSWYSVFEGIHNWQSFVLFHNKSNCDVMWIFPFYLTLIWRLLPILHDAKITGNLCVKKTIASSLDSSLCSASAWGVVYQWFESRLGRKCFKSFCGIKALLFQSL